MTTPTTTDPTFLVARNLTADEHTVELSLCPGDRATAVAAWLLDLIQSDPVLLNYRVVVAVAPTQAVRLNARLRTAQHLGAVLAGAVCSLSPGDAEALAHDLQDAAWPAPRPDRGGPGERPPGPDA